MQRRTIDAMTGNMLWREPVRLCVSAMCWRLWDILKGDFPCCTARKPCCLSCFLCLTCQQNHSITFYPVCCCHLSFYQCFSEFLSKMLTIQASCVSERMWCAGYLQYMSTSHNEGNMWSRIVEVSVHTRRDLNSFLGLLFIHTLFSTPVESDAIQYNSSAINSTFTKTIMFSFDWHCQRGINLTKVFVMFCRPHLQTWEG